MRLQTDERHEKKRFSDRKITQFHIEKWSMEEQR